MAVVTVIATATSLVGAVRVRRFRGAFDISTKVTNAAFISSEIRIHGTRPQPQHSNTVGQGFHFRAQSKPAANAKLKGS